VHADSPEVAVFRQHLPALGVHLVENARCAVAAISQGRRLSGEGKYRLRGFQLDGQSADYGDDDQMDTNYPIIREVNVSAKVFYAWTSDWSKISVGDGAGCETVDFTLNPGVTPGDFAVIVSGAGISSFRTFIHITERGVKGETDSAAGSQFSQRVRKRCLYLT